MWSVLAFPSDVYTIVCIFICTLLWCSGPIDLAVSLCVRLLSWLRPNPLAHDERAICPRGGISLMINTIKIQSFSTWNENSGEISCLLDLNNFQLDPRLPGHQVLLWHGETSAFFNNLMIKMNLMVTRWWRWSPFPGGRVDAGGRLLGVRRHHHPHFLLLPPLRARDQGQESRWHPAALSLSDPLLPWDWCLETSSRQGWARWWEANPGRGLLTVCVLVVRKMKIYFSRLYLSVIASKGPKRSRMDSGDRLLGCTVRISSDANMNSTLSVVNWT